MLGSLIAAGGSILGGILSKPKGGESTYRKTLEASRGAMDAQNQYGINALELIRSGAGAGGGAGSPRVGSVAAMTQGFDQIANVLSGQEAQQREANKVQLELAKLELEQKRGQLSTTGKKIPRAVTPGLSHKIPTDQGATPIADISKPTPMLANGKINNAIDDGGTGATIKPRDRVVLSDGSTMDITVGPDIDEVLSGAVMEGAGMLRSHVETKKMNDITDNVYGSKIEKPIKWDDRFGSKKPRGWGNMTNPEKLKFIRKRN